MQTEILQKALDDLRQVRERNAAEESARREAAIIACPEIGEVMNQRQALIFDGIRGMLRGEKGIDLEQQMESCNERLTNLLKSIGKPENWLEPIYSCPDCQDTGYVGETIRRECHCTQAHNQSDNEHDTQKFCVFLHVFFPFCPLMGSYYSCPNRDGLDYGLITLGSNGISVKCFTVWQPLNSCCSLHWVQYIIRRINKIINNSCFFAQEKSFFDPVLSTSLCIINQKPSFFNARILLFINY